MHTKLPHKTPTTTTVLVVEDRQIIRDMLVRFLEAMGFDHISAVETLDEARALAGRVAYDLYISDCNLGDDSGKDFLAEIAAMSPKSARLLISGNVHNFEGFEDPFLAKPFTIDEFFEAVNKALILSGQDPVNAT